MSYKFFSDKKILCEFYVANGLSKNHTMKSKIIIAAIISISLFITFKSKAQLPHLSLYVHGLYAAPLDKSTQDRYKYGLGAVGGLTLGSKNTRAVASIGYTNFFTKHDSPDHLLGDETYIPVKLGIRKYLPLTLHTFFLQGDMGVGFAGYKNESGSDSRFAADIGVGAHFTALEAAIVWDTFKEKKPNGWSSWLTFQLGFNLGF